MTSEPVMGQAAQDAYDDDWESTYEREERNDVHDNVRIWQQANATKAPMYTILPSTSSRTASIPPPLALDPSTTQGPPKLQILKRPTSVSASSGQGRSSSQEGTSRGRGDKSLQEREKEYAEARRRIYGDTDTSNTTATGDSRTRTAGGRDTSQSKGRNGTGKPGVGSNRPSPASSRSNTPVGSVATLRDTSVIRAPKGPTGDGKGFKSRGA
ncbi:SUZ domain-containing protein [Sporobolomyces koalae]|uniref:SUZ domain-containing protein n=1 Tax=Sporobolomyces koalae TaxID=500713 RepID=UPI00317479E5